MHLAGLMTREAAAQKILELSKDCTLNIKSLRDKFSDLDELARRLGSEHRCKLLSLRWGLPLNEEAHKQAEDVQSAAQATAAAAVCGPGSGSSGSERESEHHAPRGERVGRDARKDGISAFEATGGSFLGHALLMG